MNTFNDAWLNRAKQTLTQLIALPGDGRTQQRAKLLEVSLVAAKASYEDIGTTEDVVDFLRLQGLVAEAKMLVVYIRNRLAETSGDAAERRYDIAETAHMVQAYHWAFGCRADHLGCSEDELAGWLAA